MTLTERILPLFPTPFYDGFIDLDESEVAILKGKTMRSRPNGYVSDDNNVLFDTPKIYQQVMDKVKFFVDTVGYDVDLKMETSWVNLHGKNGWAGAHIHANSMLSGVLFLDTPPNTGKFAVKSPATNGSRLFSTYIECDKTKSTAFNTGHYHIEPVSGQCILFPSYLQHLVTHNTLDVERWTVAFNFFATGILKQKGVGQLVFD